MELFFLHRFLINLIQLVWDQTQTCVGIAIKIILNVELSGCSFPLIPDKSDTTCLGIGADYPPWLISLLKENNMSHKQRRPDQDLSINTLTI